IVLSVPFTHQHGAYQHFRVELASLTDPGTVGRIQLGIRYSNPPQPAGHHDTLWFHTLARPGPTSSPLDTLFTFPEVYMNARDTDPLDTRIDVPAYSCGTEVVSEDLTPRNHFCWSIPLLPQLELGLDFDLRRAGTLSLPVKTLLPLPSATLEGRLLYVAPGGSTNGFSSNGFGFDAVELATLVPHPPVDVAASSEGNVLSADLVPTSDSDYVPYRKGAALYLEVVLAATGAQPFGIADAGAPVLQPGGLLTSLPLNEYHDKVTQVFHSNATLHLVANGPQDRVTNPGKTLLFNFTLANDGAAGAFDLELTGSHVAWANIVTGERIRLGEGQSAPIQVAVRVSPEADTGDRADLVLAATSAADLNVRSLARLLVTVDTSAEYPDEAPLLEGGEPARKTPALPAAAAVALLAALAALARRRS
ncbi:MAG TPA: hypothetical protein VHI93_08010, partial [Candidatus Thermoplasmatota archaeon]|nr:hypothetical protein [Candidatus Thermoplasmatota archaeon]